MNLKIPLLSNLFLGLLLICGSPALSSVLPDLGSQAQQTLSPDQQRAFRAAFLRTLYESHQVNTDPVLNQWLNELGHQLAQYAELSQPPVFLPINSPQINAFAGPGGIIGIHTGLILAAENTDEVAAVIAHELAHVQQRHLLRRLQNTSQNNLAALASIMAALLIGRENPQAGFATFYTGQALSAQQQLAYSRHHETEADAVGIKILAQAGFDPKAMATFFDKLHQQGLTDSIHLPEILRTHPVSAHRLSDALNRAERLPPSTTSHPPNEYLPYIQARLNPNMRATSPSCIAAYLKSLKHKSVTFPQSCISQNWIIHLAHAKQQANTFKALKALIQMWPRNSAIRLNAAQAAPSPQQAIQILSSWQTYPAPLRTLMLDQLAARYEQIGQTDTSKLYAAIAAGDKGYVKLQQALLKEIDTSKLSPKERLLYQSLESKEKTGSHAPIPKQNFISSLNITMTTPIKTLAFTGGLSNLMLQEQRLAQSYRLSSDNIRHRRKTL